MDYTHSEAPADAEFELIGTASAGPSENATGVWLAGYDGNGIEQYSTTVYDSTAGYATWEPPYLQTSGPDVGDVLVGRTRNAGGDPEALYAANVENDTNVQWTATFADDVDWTEDRFGFYSTATFADFDQDPGQVKIATGGSSDPVVHDDWVHEDGSVTRKTEVSDSTIESVASVSHYDEKPWIYMFGTRTKGGVFAQAASPSNQSEWHTSLSEFADETILAGDYSFTADQEPAYVVASDDAGTGSWIKTLDEDGNVVNSAMYSPPSGGDAATMAPFWFLGGYFTVGPANGGSWVRSIAADLTERWTTTLDGEVERINSVGGFFSSDGVLVQGRRNGAPTFWRVATDGTLQWDVTLGADGSDVLSVTGFGPDDAFILGGRTGNKADGDGNPWLARVEDADGSVGWQETYGGADWDSLPFFTPPGAGDGTIFAENSDSAIDVLQLSTAVTRDPGDDSDDSDDGSGGGIVDQYDEDADGDIDISELTAAAQAYSNGDIDIGQLLDVANAYAGN